MFLWWPESQKRELSMQTSWDPGPESALSLLLHSTGPGVPDSGLGKWVPPAYGKSLDPILQEPVSHVSFITQGSLSAPFPRTSLQVAGCPHGTWLKLCGAPYPRPTPHPTGVCSAGFALRGTQTRQCCIALLTLRPQSLLSPSDLFSELNSGVFRDSLPGHPQPLTLVLCGPGR